MKTEIHRMGYYTHQIVTRTRRGLKWESINISTGARRVRSYSRPSSLAGFAEDVDINSTPTHRKAVLVIES